VSGPPDAGERYRRAIGLTLAALRARQGLSLRGMAEFSGVSLAYLSELEHGQKEPSGSMLSQLAAAFNMTLPELMRIIAERVDQEAGAPEISLEDLDHDDIDELARYADWLRWRKQRD
jgi:transcriptional regulator with XRE-family HTH domain